MVLTQKDKEDIIVMYTTKSIEYIARYYHVSEKKIRQVLKDNGMEIRIPTKSTLPKEWDYNTELVKKYPYHEGYKYIAVLIEDNSIQFADYINKSGVLTTTT